MFLSLLANYANRWVLMVFVFSCILIFHLNSKLIVWNYSQCFWTIECINIQSSGSRLSCHILVEVTDNSPCLKEQFNPKYKVPQITCGASQSANTSLLLCAVLRWWMPCCSCSQWVTSSCPAPGWCLLLSSMRVSWAELLMSTPSTSSARRSGPLSVSWFVIHYIQVSLRVTTILMCHYHL